MAKLSRMLEPEVELYNDGEFIVAWGTQPSSGPVKRLGVHWIGTEGDSGYPNARGNPAYMCITPRLSFVILTALLLKGGNTNKKAICKILNDLVPG
jgi:hypothetical protein